MYQPVVPGFQSSFQNYLSQSGTELELMMLNQGCWLQNSNGREVAGANFKGSWVNTAISQDIAEIYPLTTIKQEQVFSRLNTTPYVDVVQYIKFFSRIQSYLFVYIFPLWN